MDPLLIVTQVDLTGAKQLAAGVTSAMSEVQAAQAKASAQLLEMSKDAAQLTSQIRVMTESLKDAYLEYGDAAAQGNDEATEKIAQQEKALVEAKAALSALRQEMREYASESASANLLPTSGTSSSAGSGSPATAPGPTSATGAVGGAAALGAGVAASEVAAQVAAQEALDASALESAAALGVLSKGENDLKNTLAQAAPLSKVQQDYFVSDAQAAQVAASANRTLSEEAMMDASAWEAAYTAEAVATGETVELTAAQQGLSVATSEAAVAARAQGAASGIAGGGIRTATSAIGAMEGNVRSANSTAARFLLTTLGLGPALEAAFPVVGALALGSVIYEIAVKGIPALQDAIAGWNKEREKAFKQAISEAEQLDSVYARFAKTKAELSVAPQLAGPAKIDAEIAALGKYQEKITEIQTQLNKLKGAIDEASKPSTFTVPSQPTPYGPGVEQQIKTPAFELPDQGSKYQEQVNTQLAEINRMRDELMKTFNQPIPLPLSIDWKTSQGTVQEHLAEILDTTRKEIEHFSQTQAEVNLGIQGKKPQQTEEEVAAEEAAGEARLAARRKIDESAVAADEQMQKHLLLVGQITQQQEIAALAADKQRELQIQIDYLNALDAAKASRDKEQGKDPKQDTSIISNVAEVAALKNKMAQEGLEAEDDATKAALKTKLDALNEEIEAARAEAGGEVGAARESASEILNLERQKLALIVSTSGSASEQYKAAYREVEAADRALNEAIKKSDQEAAQEKISSLNKIIELEDRQASKQASEAAGAAQTEAKEAQDAIALAQASQIKPRGGAIGAAVDLGQIKAQTAQQIEIVQNEINQEKVAYASLAETRIANAQRAQQFENQLLLTGQISQRQYVQDTMKLQDQITKAVQDSDQKQTELERKKIAEIDKINQQQATKQIQLQQQISSAFDRDVNMMLFQSKSFSDALTKLWTSVVKSIIEQIVKMATTWVTQHVIMIAIEKVWQAITGSGASNNAAKAANAQQAISDVGVAAASAFAAAMTASGGLGLPAAIGAAAAVEAAGAPLVAQASAAGGWDLPSGGPFPTMLHSREMVLPEDLSDTVRDASDRRSYEQNETNNSSSESHGAPAIGALHYHAGDVHALDGSGVSSVLSKHPARMADMVQSLVRSGHVNTSKIASKLR